MYRAIDVAVASGLLLVTLPALAISAAAIRADDGGPVLFRQERIGQNGRPFQILKFRTMTVGAEHQGLGLLVAENDTRITRTGRWLRATSMDELPQLLNVLRGDMSIVGPRPTVRSQVERYTPRQTRRLEVPPGITGLAQVSGRNSLPWDERIERDIWYVDHRSLWLNLAILARTPMTLLRRDSIYGPGGATSDL